MGIESAIDITAEQRKTVLSLLEKHLPNTTAWVYGSRAKWTARPQSDLDMVVFATPEQSSRVFDLREAFEESNLPFRVDLFVWDDVPERFRKHIKQDYVVLAEKEELGLVGDGWKTMTLGEFAPFTYGKGLPVGKRNPSGVIPVFGSNGIVGYHDSSLTDGPTIIIGRKGTVGAVHYSPIPCWPIDTTFFITGNDSALTRFKYYALSVLGLEHMNSDSAVPGLNRSDAHARTLLLPEESEQRAIAHILGTLDDKIELNRRMNETLEEMARALFKSWFVDFDPVRAKMEGRDTGLPPDVADLFPDRLVESELGEIPEGWEVGVLDDAIELLSGGTPRTSVASYWNGDIPWYTAKDAPSLSDIFALDTERTITQAGVENSSTKILPAGTTIITARGTVGSLACLGIPMAMNQTCYGIQGAQGYSDFFTYWTIRKAVDELQSRTHGTIFDTITRQTFKIVDMVLPPVNVTEVFEYTVNPIMKRILNNLHESQTLTVQRNVMLPKLVSGELRVRENI